MWIFVSCRRSQTLNKNYKLINPVTTNYPAKNSGQERLRVRVWLHVVQRLGYEKCMFNLTSKHTRVYSLWVLNTFTSFDAPSRDVCGWSMHAHARHLHDG